VNAYYGGGSVATLLEHIDQIDQRVDLVRQDGKISLGEAVGLAAVVAHAAACTLEKLKDASRATEVTDEAIAVYSRYIKAENIDIPWIGERGEAVILEYGAGIIRSYIEKALDWMHGE